jgi:hypothetical protein
MLIYAYLCLSNIVYLCYLSMSIDPFTGGYDPSDVLSILFASTRHSPAVWSAAGACTTLLLSVLVPLSLLLLPSSPPLFFFSHPAPPLFSSSSVLYTLRAAGCRFKVYNTKSEDAVASFKKESMDLVLLSGDQTFEGLSTDIVRPSIYPYLPSITHILISSVILTHSALYCNTHINFRSAGPLWFVRGGYLRSIAITNHLRSRAVAVPRLATVCISPCSACCASTPP